MGKEAVIADIAKQLEEVCGSIKSLAKGLALHMEGGVDETYESMLLDEVKHTQILALELTRIVTDGVQEDEAEEPEEETVDNSEPEEGEPEEAEAEDKAEAKEE